MAGLSIGEHVSDLDGSHDGRLVEIDGATGYVLQSNGVEVEFPLSRLKPYEPPKVAEQRTLSGPLRDRTLTPQHKAILASIPPELTAAIAKSYDGGEPSSRPSYAALPDSKKLDAVRIHMPALPQRLLAPHMSLVMALRNLPKPGR